MPGELLAQFGIPVRLPNVPLSKQQKAYLLAVHQKNGRPSKERCSEIAEELGLKFTKVDKWFRYQQAKPRLIRK